MYFLTFEYSGKQHVGVLNSDKTGVIPLDNYYPEQIRNTTNSLLDLIKQNENEVIVDLLRKNNWNLSESIPLEEIKVCAPIPQPDRDVICLGLNYIDHANEITDIPGAEKNIPQYPVYFSKRVLSAIGHNDFIDGGWEYTTELDYEVELAVIIGKSGINISKDEAEKHIFGYTIINDVSARDIQRKHTQWFKGKSLETYCPMGPYIVHKSAISSPSKLGISSTVNGEIRQCSNTSRLIFDIPTIISDLSKGMRLVAGDIIATGTPAGVGLGFNPPKFLAKGDVIECEIEMIGKLTNTVR